MVLKEDELIKVCGGANGKKIGIGVLIAALGSFIVGIIDGFLRPLACNK